MRAIRVIGLTLGAALLMSALGAPSARAGVNCSRFTSWCPEVISHYTPSGGDQSTPAPGAFGLLALGAAVGIARMRQRRK